MPSLRLHLHLHLHLQVFLGLDVRAAQGSVPEYNERIMAAFRSKWGDDLEGANALLKQVLVEAAVTAADGACLRAFGARPGLGGLPQPLPHASAAEVACARKAAACAAALLRLRSMRHVQQQ